MRRILFRRGFTDKLYYYNFVFVMWITMAVVVITALSGLLQVTDMSALSMIPPAAFAELGIHTGFVIWKAKAENCRKYKDENKIEQEMEECDLE